eukprot:UN18900
MRARPMRPAAARLASRMRKQRTHAPRMPLPRRHRRAASARRPSTLAGLGGCRHAVVLPRGPWSRMHNPCKSASLGVLAASVTVALPVAESLKADMLATLFSAAATHQP